MSQIRYEGRREAPSPVREPKRKEPQKNMQNRRKRRRINPIIPMILVIVLGVGAVALFTDVFSKEKSSSIGFSGDVQEPEPESSEQVSGDETSTTAEGTTQGTKTQVSNRIEATGEVSKKDGLLIVGDSVFETYGYSDSATNKYANAINAMANALDGKATVYDIIVPLSSGVVLPDSVTGTEYGIDDMKAASESILNKMNDKVKTVSIFDTLMNHRTEYIYFRTDHHWTALGAYYAYQQFCLVKGITPNAVSSYDTISFAGFLGTLYSDVGKPEVMQNNPDYVLAYYPHSSGATMKVTDSNNTTYDMPILYNETNASAGLKYSTFISGDNPYSVITNPEITDGSACVVVKESFGNAFVPFLIDHYQTIYVIDYRYWSGNLVELVEANSVKDVIYINNLAAAQNKTNTGSLQGLID